MASAAGTARAAGTRRGWVALRWLFVAGLVAASAQGLALFARIEAQILPVQVIAIDGEVHRHSLPVLQETVADHLDGGILLADLAAIKRAVEGLPWVAAVSLRRVWPERLELHVIEHRPIARWGEGALVTAAGAVFHPDPATIPPRLPRLIGDDGDAPTVVARYLAWRERLARLDLRIAALERDARGAWRLELHGGPELVLGSRRVEARLNRFIQAYPSLRLARLPVAVDLRYANGFAVRWADDEGAIRSVAAPRGDKGTQGRS